MTVTTCSKCGNSSYSLDDAAATADLQSRLSSALEHVRIGRESFEEANNRRVALAEQVRSLESRNQVLEEADTGHDVLCRSVLQQGEVIARCRSLVTELRTIAAGCDWDRPTAAYEQAAELLERALAVENRVSGTQTDGKTRT